MNGSNSYKERNSGINLGEQLFEEYCTKRQVYFKRLGFDEKNDSIPHFYRLSPIVRNIPDYLVVSDKGSRLVSVKGTANLKKSEALMIPQFLEWYHSKDCPLWYAFCFSSENKPFFMTPDKVIQLYEQAEEKQWSDGVKYRTLKIE
jgi:hypothetical protein